MLSGGSRFLTLGLALAVLVAPVAVGATEKAAASEAKAEKNAKSTEAKPGDKAADGKTAETKTGEAKTGDAKTGDAKSAGSKSPDGKTSDGKSDGKSEGKAQDGKADGEKAGEGAPSEKPAKPRKKKSTASKEPVTIPGEGPSPASPPPLTMRGLRDELHREGAGGNIDAGASPRTKVEQMLAEIAKTREAMHAETLRLEGMMAQEPAEGAAAGGAAAGAAGVAAGGKPAKNPLDILAKALRGIKPEQAAPIVSRLDKRLAATVLQRMPPVDAGKIMGAMKPDTAAELATQIAMRVPGSDGKGEVRK